MPSISPEINLIIYETSQTEDTYRGRYRHTNNLTTFKRNIMKYKLLTDCNAVERSNFFRCIRYLYFQTEYIKRKNNYKKHRFNPRMCFIVLLKMTLTIYSITTTTIKAQIIHFMGGD